MTEPRVTSHIDQDGVARLTMNRPELRNAFDEDMIGMICDEMGKLSGNSDVNVIVLTGAGEAFSAGADLNMMQRVATYSATQNKDDARRLAHMLESIYNSPKPTIALVNGPAMGGGLGLIAACDIAIASEDAFFALSEVRVGLIPAVISPFVIEAIGTRQARRFFLTGERFNAAKAKDIGLIHKIIMQAQLEDGLKEVLDALLVCAPNALTQAKELIRDVAYKEIDTNTRELTANRIATIRASSEGKEGISAFLEKRKPDWIKHKKRNETSS